MPLNKDDVIKALNKLRGISKKRNFSQSVDLQISLKRTDVKKPENQINEFIVLPFGVGKKVSVAAFVDKELVEAAKKVFNEVIPKDSFAQYAANKRSVQRLVRRHKFFIAQANIMPDVAKTFGRYLGPKGRMPNPKAGCVVPPKAELLEPTFNKLQKTVNVKLKNEPTINVMIGVESQRDDELAENAVVVYNLVESKLPRGADQLGGAFIKFTMSESVRI